MGGPAGNDDRPTGGSPDDNEDDGRSADERADGRSADERVDGRSTDERTDSRSTDERTDGRPTGGREDERPRSKVARLIREYDLSGYGAELEAAWTGDGVERRSLRDLADAFNRRLLERALLEVGETPPAAEIEGYYAALTGEESEAVRIETERRLEATDVDVGELAADFVTYQAMRTYLREYRGAEYERSESQIETERETIERLLTRTETVTTEKLDRLRETGRIDVGEFGLLIEAEVFCRDCGAQYPVQDLLDRGGCDCRE